MDARGRPAAQTVWRQAGPSPQCSTSADHGRHLWQLVLDADSLGLEFVDELVDGL
jgi:hypothetical protein